MAKHRVAATGPDNEDGKREGTIVSAPNIDVS